MKPNSKILLASIIIFAIILRIIFRVGLIGTGDTGHVYYAYKVSNGDFKLQASDPLTAARIGFVYPIAFFYKIFGVSEFSAYAYSLLTGIASILLIYFLGKLLFNEKVGIIGAFLLSFFPLNVNYSTQVYADLAQSFFTGLAVYLFLLAEKKSLNAQKEWMYLISGISVGISFLTKESGIVIFLFFALFILYKLIFGKQSTKIFPYLLISAGFVLVILLQGVFSYFTTGDFLLRYHMIDNMLSPALKNLYNYNGYKLIERLFVHLPYLMLTNINFGFFTIFILLAIFYILKFKKTQAYPLVLWFAAIFLYLNFGSTSLTNYVPLPAGTPRYLEMLTMPGILMLSFFISGEELMIKKFIAPFTMIFLLISSIGFVYINPDRNLANAERELAKFFNSEKNLVVYTDAATKELLSFFTGFKKDVKAYWTSNYPFTGSTELVKPEEMKNAYVVVNKRMLSIVPENYKVAFPKIYYEAPKNWTLIKKIESKQGDILVYYAP